MADLPWPAYTAVSAGPFKTLSALWRHVSGETLWAARATDRRPWVCPSAKTLARLTGRCERSVQEDCRRLREAGWIARAWGQIEGRQIYGWELADLEGADQGRELAAVTSDTEETCGVTPQPGKRPRKRTPKKPAGSPRTETQHTEETCGVTPQAEPADADERAAPAQENAPASRPHARPPHQIHTEGSCGAAADATAADAAPAHRGNLRGQAAGGFGPADLVRLLGEVRLPAPAQRITADRPTMRRAQQLLEVHLEGLGEAEAQAARQERFADVLAVALEFSQICQEDPEQLRWWCGQLLELDSQRRDGRSGVSRWEHAMHRVAERRGKLWAPRTAAGQAAGQEASL